MDGFPGCPLSPSTKLSKRKLYISKTFFLKNRIFNFKLTYPGHNQITFSSLKWKWPVYTQSYRKISKRSSLVSSIRSKYTWRTRSTQQALCYGLEIQRWKTLMLFTASKQSSWIARKKYSSNNKWWWKVVNACSFYSQSHFQYQI